MRAYLLWVSINFYLRGIQAAYDKTPLGGMLDVWLNQVKSVIDQNKNKIHNIENKDV
jgi:hypothetical protein